MKRLAFVAIFLLLGGVGAARAAVISFTSSAAFLAALGGSPVTVEGYETLAADFAIPNGSIVNGLTYSGFSRDGGRVDAGSYIRFGARSLAMIGATGVNDFFLPDEGFTVDFGAPVDAVGLFFNVGVSPAGALSISTAAGSAANGPTYDQSTFYFVGLIADTPFTAATILGVSGISTGFNVDDLTFHRVSVPEPITLVLVLAALASVGVTRLRAGRQARPYRSS